MTTPFHNLQKIKYKRNSKQTNGELSSTALYGERLTSEYSYFSSLPSKPTSKCHQQTMHKSTKKWQTLTINYLKNKSFIYY